MASIRFPGKILFPFFGYPMIEHVRRRALLSQKIIDVYVATCDPQIAEAVTAHGGKVILTDDQHRNGTSRIAEAMQEIEASHIILLQGDEPLLLPSYVDTLIDTIANEPTGDDVVLPVQRGLDRIRLLSSRSPASSSAQTPSAGASSWVR